MMFLLEEDLKVAFWKKYSAFYFKKDRIKRYQFECIINQRPIDLVTVDFYNDNYQINAFEFKLNDIKKAFAQAKWNIQYSNKSWIVIPIEKENLIKNKYMYSLKDEKYIGVIGVNEDGTYKIIYQPKFQKEIKLNQDLMNFILGGVQ